MDFVHKVQQTIREEKLLVHNETVVVAVSGGPDSMALLHALHYISEEWQLRLIVAHMNHQFRGAESDEEAHRVRMWAAELGWPCEVANIDVSKHMQDASLSAQVASREKRYEFLLQVATKYDACKIATAHHADDQAETVLMRMLRGSSPSGLSGIPMQRPLGDALVIRPLLACYKLEILRFCEQHNIAYNTDSSNVTRDYFRNEVRLDVMPFLQRWNERLPEALNRLAQMMVAEDAYMEQATQQYFDKLVTKNEQNYTFSKKAFLFLPIALQRRLVKLILNYLCLDNDANDFVKVDLIREALRQESNPSLVLHLGNGQTLSLQYDLVTIGHVDSELVEDYAWMIGETPYELNIPDTQAKLSIQVLSKSEWEARRANRDRESTEMAFDLHKIALPLTVRNRRKGDRMKVAGLNGSKKVKDIFIDEKIPPSLRRSIPIIVDARGELLWIPTIRFSDAALIDDDTVQVLHMNYSGNI